MNESYVKRIQSPSRVRQLAEEKDGPVATPRAREMVTLAMAEQVLTEALIGYESAMIICHCSNRVHRLPIDEISRHGVRMFIAGLINTTGIKSLEVTHG